MAFPLVPLPTWRALSVADRLQTLLGMTLDDCYGYLALPIEGLDAAQSSAKLQVIRAILHTTTKLGIEHGRLSVERDKVLSAMAADLRDE
jgi:hypothetical protein